MKRNGSLIFRDVTRVLLQGRKYTTPWIDTKEVSNHLKTGVVY